VNPKIAGKWMFIPLKYGIYCIGIDPYPYGCGSKLMIPYGGFHTWGIPKMIGLFHGKTQSKMDDN